MIKVVSFDIGNTLYKCSSTKIDILSEKYNIEKAKIRNAYKNTFQILNEDFNIICKKFCELLSIDFNEDISNSLCEIFVNKVKDTTYVYNKIESLLKSLKEKKYILITFSNNCKYNYIETELIKKYFDYNFNSFEMGYTKNDNEAFDYIKKKLNVKSNEILHIGDNYNSDYIKAIENGWNAVMFNNEHECIKLENLFDVIKLINGYPKSSVVLKKYTYLYEIIYDMEKVRLFYIFDANEDIKIYHVGSTAIKGVKAKPIIDIAVLVNRLNDIVKYIEKMKGLGYYFRDDNGKKGEFLFYRGDEDNRYCYIHVVEKNSVRCKNFLHFKNYLKKHDDCIKEYNDLKEKLCFKYKNERKKYTRSKNDFIQNIIKKYENTLAKGRDLDE